MKEEFKICLENSERALKAQGTKERDFYAGKCSGIEECLNIDLQENILRAVKEPDEEQHG